MELLAYNELRTSLRSHDHSVSTVTMGGVLRLEEYQHVRVIILDDIAADGERIQFAPREEFEALADYTITLGDVRKALSQIPGSLDPDFAAERNGR